MRVLLLLVVLAAGCAEVKTKIGAPQECIEAWEAERTVPHCEDYHEAHQEFLKQQGR